MHSIHFRVKLESALTVADFEEAPLWAAYYAWDEIEEIIGWGFAEADVLRELELANWEDGAVFPLPNAAVDTDWMRGKYFGATITSAAGLEFPGYIGEQNRFVVLFHDDRQFTLYARPPDDQAKLLKALGQDRLYPLRISNRVTGECWDFDPRDDARSSGAP